MPDNEAPPQTGRKLFFGLFIFPLLIAVGMAVLLCTVVLLTNEEETPETLITAIKTGAPSKRWQKAFELSNELTRGRETIRNEGVMKEIIHILDDTEHYDAKTRGYMAVALSHFKDASAVAALRKALSDESEDVQLYAIWSLGSLSAEEAVGDLLPFLKSESVELKKMAVYVLGVFGRREAVSAIQFLLEDPAADVRWNAALALARMGDPEGLPVLMKMLEREDLTAGQTLTEDKIEAVMVNALKGIALIKNPDTISAVEKISKTDKNMKVRQAAIEALEYLKGQKKEMKAEMIAA